MTHPALIKLAALSLAASAACTGAAITNIQVVNDSTPDFVATDAIRAREFRSAAFTPASATTTADSSSFTNRIAWMSSHRVFPGPSGLPLTHGNILEYDLIFTVEDPLLTGYNLTIDSTIRGYVSALWQGNVGVFTSFVFASGTLMGATLDDGTGFGSLLPDIQTDTEVATATPANPFDQKLVSYSGTYDAGHYTGTRTFTLRYGTVGANTGVGLQNYNIGEGNVRFGLDPTYGGFVNAMYPGTDGEPASSHGHFVTVTAAFAPAAVPEPGTFLPAAVAITIAAAIRLRKVAA